MNTLILASASKSRALLLQNAGVLFTIVPAHINERIIKESGLAKQDSIEAIALQLSRAKAACIAQEYPQAYVIGADQMLECHQRFFDKPASRTEAEEHLRFLRGKTHVLYSGVAVYQGNECLWEHSATASITMRDFSDEFLQHYLDKLGQEALTMVGCCAVEGYGVQLLERIDGNHATILGLPLLPLLAFLRDRGILPV